MYHSSGRCPSGLRDSCRFYRSCTVLRSGLTIQEIRIQETRHDTGSDALIKLTVVVVPAADSSEGADAVAVTFLALREALLSRVGDSEAQEEDHAGKNGGVQHFDGGSLLCGLVG